jgi:DNA-binding transcriptional LysR family regulator
MALEQLRIFVPVAELQHVTEAARAFNLARSAASHAIASLDMPYDMKLFDRVVGVHLGMRIRPERFQ